MRNVLVVDDNTDGAMSLKIFLELIGHRATVAHSGLEALEHVRKEMPEFIFLDLGLPGMNGYEVAEHIRQMPHGKSPRIFAVTGWGSERDKQRSKDAGCDMHLIKPIDLREAERLLQG
jgi:CheY-like chemotaxis protein